MNTSHAGPPTVLELALLAGSVAEGELLLVRHGQQGVNNLNDPARPKGGDVSLSELGARQAQAVADGLAGERIDAVFCSHLLRAHETAQAIATRHGLTPIVDEDLAEVGVYRELPPGATVLSELGAEGKERVEGEFFRTRRWDAFPLTESRAELETRLTGALDRIRAAYPDSSKVAIVCHGGVINQLIRQVIWTDSDMFFYPAHTSVSRLSRGDGRLALRSINEAGHLVRAGVDVTF